jgi:hypothetical protein
MNPEIAKLIMYKTEAEAKEILKGYRAIYRVTHRDGSALEYVVDDRNDKRYSLMVANGVVARVYAG